MFLKNCVGGSGESSPYINYILIYVLYECNTIHFDRFSWFDNILQIPRSALPWHYCRLPVNSAVTAEDLSRFFEQKVASRRNCLILHTSDHPGTQFSCFLPISTVHVVAACRAALARQIVGGWSASSQLAEAGSWWASTISNRTVQSLTCTGPFFRCV